MKIPVIEYYSKDAPEQFVKSIKETGFAVLSNTFIYDGLAKAAYEELQKFFADADLKQLRKFDPETQAGYFPFKSEKAKDASVFDLKEFYHYFPNTTSISAPPLGFANDKLAFELERLGMEVLDWLQRGYTETSEIDWALAVDNSPNTLFRALHYPPLSGTAEPGAVRSAAHEDINFITLLPAATQPGLQVKDLAGNWHDVPTHTNCVVCNIGDMLQLLTKGYYPSTTHRVVNPVGENVSRYSVPLFLHPKPDTRLSPEMTASEYLDQRLKQIGLK